MNTLKAKDEAFKKDRIYFTTEDNKRHKRKIYGIVKSGNEFCYENTYIFFNGKKYQITFFNSKLELMELTR